MLVASLRVDERVRQFHLREPMGPLALELFAMYILS
jgi:hypothetical protein